MRPNNTVQDNSLGTGLGTDDLKDAFVDHAEIQTDHLEAMSGPDPPSNFLSLRRKETL
jgi:hypothetical protein